ncbi:MAG: hypothetical protein LDL41_14580 [Coleofasciculus sp. S288]|nr:hypothetical protein [Coleofasciculus sp. S288]
MALSKKTGVILAVLVSAVSYTAIACDSEPESEQRLSQANLVENEAVVTGEILGIEDERVRLRLAEGETREILVPRSEIERLALARAKLIAAVLDTQGRVTEVRLVQSIPAPIAEAEPQVVLPIPTDTSEEVRLAQVQSAPTATPEIVKSAQAQPAPTATPRTVEVAPVPPAPTPIAQAQLPAEQPTAVRALW